MRARYGAELPPFISIVRHPSRPVILGMDIGCGFFAYSWKFPACSGAFLLTIDSFSFLLTALAFLLTVGALLLTVGKCI